MNNAHSKEHRIGGRTRPDNGYEAQIGSSERDVSPQFPPDQGTNAHPQETPGRAPCEGSKKRHFRSDLGTFPGSATQRQGVASATHECSVQKARSYPGATAVKETRFPLRLPTRTPLQAGYLAI